jgi:hypothetical protein
VAAELVEHGALGRENPPVGLIRGMGAGEDVERLVETADIGERPAIGAKQRRVARIGKRCLFEDRGRLAALATRAQGSGIGEGDLRIVGVVAIAGADRRGLVAPFGLRFAAVAPDPAPLAPAGPCKARASSSEAF